VRLLKGGRRLTWISKKNLFLGKHYLFDPFEGDQALLGIFVHPLRLKIIFSSFLFPNICFLSSLTSLGERGGSVTFFPWKL